MCTNGLILSKWINILDVIFIICGNPLDLSSTCGERTDLGTLYDCTQTVPLGVYGHPILRNCYHMFFSHATVKILVTLSKCYQFLMYSCSNTVVELTLIMNINLLEDRNHKEKFLRVWPYKSFSNLCIISLQHQLMVAFLVTLFPVFITFWKSHVDLSYSRTFRFVITKNIASHNPQIHGKNYEIRW